MSTVTIPSGTRLARLVSAVGGLLLAGLAVQSALGYAFADSQPALGYRIAPGNVDAVASYADYLVRTSTEPGVSKRIEGLARDAVSQAPLAPFALRSLGFALLSQKRTAEAAPVLELAGRASLRDLYTHAWLFDRRYRAKRIDAAVEEADTLLRQRTTFYEQLMPSVVELLRDPRTVEPLARALARQPIWRAAFLQHMGLEASNFAPKFTLLQRLRALGAPADNTEVTPLFRSAWDKIDARTLRASWDALVTLPEDQKGLLLLDGDFEHAQLPPPFAWLFYPHDEVYAERARRGDAKGLALYASFDGKAQTSFAGQQLLLAPGRYRLTGEMLGQDAIHPGQFSWQVVCRNAGGGEARANIPLSPDADNWKGFAADFEVPPGCADQQLWLVGAANESSDPASIWVDSLALARR